MKTIHIKKLSNLAMVAGGEKKIKAVIRDGIVMRWVGIGWVDEGEPTEKQKQTLPVVVE